MVQMDESEKFIRRRFINIYILRERDDDLNGWVLDSAGG